MKELVTTVLILSCVLSVINAQVINVPSEYTTIQAAIDATTKGDTVLVAEGTYYENINFNGKAITVASKFILDTDTTHVSKTIIDGSQFTDWEDASTVSMTSGEDTTSVLMGFTVTGGEGSLITRGDYTDYYGGGIVIMNSGGKIINNIIEGNHKTLRESVAWNFGAGISASVNHNHTAIIRNNKIRKNSIHGKRTYGAGVFIDGGRIIVEDNLITDNTLTATVNWDMGAGVFWASLGDSGIIEEVIIRNNFIAGNTGTSVGGDGGGGGIGTGIGFQGEVQIYNNVICNNSTGGYGGGINNYYNRLWVCNNTIYNNKANEGGNSLAIVDATVVMNNNIIWSDVDNNVSDINIDEQATSPVWAYFNLLKGPFEPEAPVTAQGNNYLKPAFKPNAYALEDGSPGIGWGIDTIQIDSIWYSTPAKDLAGNPRPDPIDSYLDIGAYESTFERTDLSSIADLSYIGLWDRMLEPSFNPDTLNYVLTVPDTTAIVPQLEAVTAAGQASFDIVAATDLESTNPTERITTIIVTASDGITQKTYTVEFYLNSTDASLSELSASQGDLDPLFESMVTYYRVWLPYRSTETPEVNYVSTHPKATVEITPAPDITNRNQDVTTIKVNSEEGEKFQMKYYVEFNPDPNFPRISLVNDTVHSPDSIMVMSTKNGHIFLLKEQTDKILDSLVAHMIDSTTAVMNDTVYLPSKDLDDGVYWLYAVNQYKSVSEAAKVTIIKHINAVFGFNSAPEFWYPNPVEDALYIDMDQPISSVELCNSVGAKILTLYKPENRIDLSHLKEGTYFIRIETHNGEFYTGKVIKH